ncbi:MAG: hypothetical protein JWN03_7857 [Nocardia sp.]|uniref:hypothetical protein n=1 Tax=Nocardia sp. TaxID=1821 RepID=UPI00262B0ECF|nr:hypothetical protein [Nocardia sp.]MCU1647582.1 hypothetical protein [Nocardia sp.]
MSQPSAIAADHAERDERRHFAAAVNRALPDRGDRYHLIAQVTGKYISADEYPTANELRQVLNAIPAHLAQQRAEVDAEAARCADEERTQAARTLAALEEAIRAGAHVSAAELAAAQAEASAEAKRDELAAEGTKARAKAGRELSKRQESAKSAVRKDLPIPPLAEIAAAVDAAEMAIGRVDVLRAAHRDRIEAAKAVLRDGGVVERSWYDNAREGIDDSTHGHDRLPAVTIDDVTYGLDSITDALVEIGRYALQMSGTGRMAKH